ncbi:hypothetical protein B6N26_00582 [Salmonella enterica subsp. enterica]|nr:hypothetical protein [Salmonella enterica]ARV66924.1 hypothetical protein B6N26_00582 [Salmonella enterica subsp. enterica]
MTIYITELVTGLLVIAGLFIWGEVSMVNWMLAAIKCIGVGWILLTFFIVLRSYISLVNGGKDPFSTLFGAAFTWVLIGIVPVAIAKMAWRFIN